MQATRDVHNKFNNGQNLSLNLDKLNNEIGEKGDKEVKEALIKKIVSYSSSAEQANSYKYSFNQWKKSIQSQKDCIVFEIKSISKSLLGVGNDSVHELGVQLSYPMGVPYISGSSIKGLLTSYLARNGGEEWFKDSDHKSKNQVELFGGNLEQDGKTTSYIGNVIFNDAWLCPEQNKWFVEDIINVHHQKYYSGERLPDGAESPIPIKMAGLRPKLEFYFSMQGDQSSLEFLLPVIEQALKEEGLGAKTALGYGRFKLSTAIENILKNNASMKENQIKAQEAADKQRLKNQASDQDRVIIQINEYLEIQDYEAINSALKTAEQEIESWPQQARLDLADFMEKYFNKIGWCERGVKSNKKKKQEQKKKDRIHKIRSE